MTSFARYALIALGLSACPAVADATGLEFPANARQTASESDGLSSLQLPITSWQDGAVQTIWAEGDVHRQAWQIQASGLTTLQLLAPLRDQLVALGFSVIFECEARDCGGFDFRYATDVLPEPEMHVDLGDYRYAVLQRAGEQRPEYVSLMVSRSTGRGFVQVTWIGPQLGADGTLIVSTTSAPVAGATTATSPSTTEPTAKSGDLMAQLELTGRTVLADLRFETGSSQLSDGPFASLADLANHMKAHPDRKIVLVGHTDTDGALSSNIALSKKRAGAVRERLASVHGVAPERMQAEGVGYLAPLTSNATEDGRTLNRRVEVILSAGD